MDEKRATTIFLLIFAAVFVYSVFMRDGADDSASSKADVSHFITGQQSLQTPLAQSSQLSSLPSFIRDSSQYSFDRFTNVFKVRDSSLSELPYQSSPLSFPPSSLVQSPPPVTTSSSSSLLPPLSRPLSQSTITTVAHPSSSGIGVDKGDIRVGSDGLPILVLYEASGYVGVPGKLLFVKCTTLDCSGTITTSLAFFGNIYSRSVSLVVGSDGLPFIAYASDDASLTAGGLYAIHCGDLSCSTGNIDTLIDPQTFNSYSFRVEVATAPDGLPVMAYYKPYTYTIKVAKCGDVVCSTSQTSTLLLTGADYVNKLDIAVGNNNLPVITYSTLSSDLGFYKCHNSACTSGQNTVLESFPPGIILDHISMIIGSDGYPVIAYRKVDQLTIPTLIGIISHKFIHCLDLSCSNFVTTVIETTQTTAIIESPGYGNSIAIGPQGKPMISYVDIRGSDTQDQVRLVRCGNLDCSSGNVISDIDLFYGPSFYFSYITSLTLGSDNLPLIAYEATHIVGSQGHVDVRVAKCHTQNCGPVFNPASYPPKKVFASSVLHNGGFGSIAGLGGASTLCNNLASQAGLSGQWWPWLSINSQFGSYPAIIKIPNSKYVRVGDGAIVADVRIDLVDGTLDNPIDHDEFGNVVSPSKVWTGTDIYGKGVYSDHDCFYWGSGSSSYSALTGDTSATNTDWTHQSSSNTCNNLYRLYCFER